MSIMKVIMGIAIVLFIFSSEIEKSLNNWFKKPWFLLFAPLWVATSLIVYFDSEVVWVLLFFKFALYRTILFLTELIPLSPRIAWPLAAVFVLLMISILPVYGFCKFKQKKVIVPFVYTNTIAAMLWLFVVVIYSTNVYG